MLNFSENLLLEDVVDLEEDSINLEPNQETKNIEDMISFGIEEIKEDDAIKIIPMNENGIILHGELEVTILVEALKKYLHE